MKFVFAYHGGSVPEDMTDEERNAVMGEWMAWMGSHEKAFLDMGNPIAATKTVASDGTTDGGGANPLTGYSLIEAADLDAATKIAEECPVLKSGGTVEVAQAIDM